MASRFARLVAGAGLVMVAPWLHAEAPTPERVLELCARVESPAHCGRLVEAEQLKSLPNLATRDGDTLKVTLFPSGTRSFVDALASSNEKSYALWDYWSPVNAVVLFVTSGDELSYAVLQRANGQLTTLPAEPVLAPDRQRIAVADFCGRNCTNEITVWRISRDGIKRELGYRPLAAWSDVTVAWKDPETIAVQFTPPGAAEARTQDRKLTAADWQRF
jgi:hypothetical protein